MHKLIKGCLARRRNRSKTAQPRTANEEPPPFWLVVISGTTFGCMLTGEVTYKVLHATHELPWGNRLLEILIGAGCIPMLIAAGALLVLKRALDNVLWVATATLGLGMIALAFGYFLGYSD